MESLCTLCLSAGRDLHALGSADMQSALDTDHYKAMCEDGGDVVLMCWECAAILAKLRRFRARARLARQLLRNNLSAQKVSLSTLCTQFQDGCHIEFNHEDDIDSSPSPSPLILDTKVEDEIEEIKETEEFIVNEKVLIEECRSKTRKKKKKKIATVKREKKHKDKAKGKSDISDRFDTTRMSQSDMLKQREEDRRRPLYVKARFKCESCIFGYNQEQLYKDHVKDKHSPNSEYECPICLCRMDTARRLATHTARHYALYSCRVCAWQHRDFAKMMRHYETQHETEKHFPCPECDMVFPRYYALRYHKECCHKSSTACEFCGKVLSTPTNHKRHLMLHTGMPSRECEVCGKTFRGEALYRSHLRVHSSEKPADAYCAECNVHFKHLYIYRQHLKSNSRHLSPDSLKYSCNMCERKFRLPSHRDVHVNSVHLKKTKHVCPHCDKNVCTASRLRAHVRRVHDKVPATRDKVCDICAKAFATKAILENHIRTHTGERPFHCAVCGATFGHSSALWTHNKLVHLKLNKSHRLRPQSAGDNNSSPRGETS